MKRKVTPPTPNVYYHGTSQLEWESIQRDGLIPAKAHGSDYWAEHSRGNLVPSHPVNRPPAVYVTSVIHHAEWFARMAAEVNHSKPVVLAVTLPHNAVILPDTEDDSGIAFRYEGSIPPELVSLHHEVLNAAKATNGDIFSVLFG